MDSNLVMGLAIPFIGTTLGSAMVFLMKNKINDKVEKVLLGFAAGVMIAASVWSLLIPAIDMAEEAGKTAWMPATVGFLFGVLFLLILDSLIPHLHLNDDKPEGIKANLKKNYDDGTSCYASQYSRGNGSRCNFCRSIAW